MMRMKKYFALAGVIALVSVAMVPAAAFGASSSDEGYKGSNVVAGIEESGGGGGGNAPVAAQTETQGTNESGSLAFTGSDLGVLAAAGGLLLAMGFGLRRLTHRPTQA
jgi:hypothetical protein